MSPKPFARLVASFLIGIFILTANPTTALAVTAGPSSGSTFANASWSGSDEDWANTGNIVSSNDSRASVTLASSGNVSDYLSASGFGFAIPVGNTIDGITVSIERREGNLQPATIRDNVVRLVKGGTVVGTNKAATGTNWPTTEASAAYGSASDLWGTTWTAAEINASNFGVVLAVNRTTGGDERADVDHITVTVYHSADVTAPVLAQVTPVPTLTNDTTPNYTFSSTEAGTITYGGDCSSADTTAGSGNNTQTFNVLSAGLHNNCTIQVTDGAGNASAVLAVNAFTIDTTQPTVTINQGGTQSDPTGTAPIVFDVIFSESVTGFGNADVTIGGTTGGAKTVVVAGSGTTYTASVTGMTTSGIVTATVNLNAAQDPAGNNSLGSSSGDNSVTYNHPTWDILASANAGGSITPSGIVTVNQGLNQAFAMLATTGNILREVFVDAVAQGGIQSYTFTNVTANHSISAVFEGGWSQPGLGTQIGNGGAAITPNNAFSSNDSHTTFDNGSDVVDYGNFGLLIPVGATIDGIEVAVEGNRNGSRTAGVSLSWDGTNLTTASAIGGTFNTVDKTIVIGGPTDTWGRTWTAAEFADGLFEVRLDAEVATNNLNIDQVQVKVYYTLDTTAPAGGSVTYTDGYYTALSVPVTYTLGTDAGSGLNNASGKIQRASASLTGGVCGSFGSFTDLVTEFDGSYTDTSVVNGNCYQYQYIISDNAGPTPNTATYTSANIVKVDTEIPSTVIDAALGGGNPITNGTLTTATNISFSFTPTDLVSGVAFSECKLDGGTYAPCSPALVSYSAIADGTHTVYVRSTDNAGNIESTATLTWTIDTTGPVVTVPSDISIEATSGAGATHTFASSALDAIQGSIVPACTPTSGSIFVLGPTLVTCTAVDAAGNSGSASFTVTVTDTTAPVITLTGLTPVNLGTGDTYTEQGATALDNVDGSFAATVGGDVVDTAIPGTYVVTYNATDLAGNLATEVTRTVNVVDDDAPVITLTGSTPVNLGTGDTYTELGATALDNVDGSFAATVGGDTVNSAIPGTYTVTYDASDLAGNDATQVTRTVIVTDDDAPVITLTGSTPVNLGTGDVYVEDGAVALDNIDGSFAATIGGDLVNTAIPGTYTVTYNAADLAGNVATQVTRTVIIGDDDAPIITLSGATPVNLGTGDTYTEEGAVALDNVDGSFAATIGGDVVNTAAPGAYIITYNATDLAGNPATEVTRTVNVIDDDAPVIDAHGDESAEATSALGATVTYTAPNAVDNVDGTFAATCLPASGSTFALGDTVVACDASDSNSNDATQTVFTVHVVDTTAPVITLTGTDPINLGVGDTYSEDGAVALDTVDGSFAAMVGGDVVNTALPGIYVVSYGATDIAGNPATPVTRTVNVVDDTAPVVTVPADITAEATSASGAVVTFVTSASDDVDGALVTSCDHNSGDTFSLGSTLVTCTAADSATNVGTASFTITVQDTTAPVIAIHADETVEATSGSGAVVTYVAPNATDAVDGSVPATCLPASGTTFAIGSTPVLCNYTDAAGNGALQTSFTVMVTDNGAPVIDAHADETVEATSALGATVVYTAPNAVDTVDGTFLATCLPASNTMFAIGDTVVTCTATDSNLNDAASVPFTVHVVDTTAPVITLVGASPVELTVGDTYLEQGATTADAVDGASTAVVGGDTVNTAVAGTYTVRYNKTDLTGNVALEVTRTVTVSDAPAPVITLEDAGSPTETSVVVTWTTDHPATSRVVYDTVSHDPAGAAPNYGYAFTTLEDDNLVTNHSITVTGLVPGTPYFFRGVSHGSPESISNEVTETTLIPPPPDVCPNIDGPQSEIPEGYELVEGQCVLIPPPPVDVCPNIDGAQASVPEGYEIIEGQCVLIPPPPVDVCPNIDGAQGTIPEGYQIVEGQCVEIPPAVDVCPNIDGDQATVPEGYQLVEGACVVIPPPPTDVCPNIEGAQGTVPEGYQIVEGQCVLIPPPPAFATVVATKIVCNAESDLPNWGDGAANITASTASNFLATHPNCHPQEDWQFEWAPNNTANPGSNLLGPAGGAWTTTSVTDSNGVATVIIPASTGKTWIREVLEAGYILFSDWVGGPLSAEDEYSAEMYCNTDVVNYDNYDWILNPAAGATYYCIAFNAVAPTTGTLIIDKVTNPEGDNTSFHFDASFDEDGFDLADESAPYEVELPVGTYSVSENAVDGWTLSDATCVDGEGDYFAPSDIFVAWGDTVTCTFTNTQDEPEEEFGKLVVIKRTRGGNDTFNFTVSGSVVNDFSITTHHRYGVKVLKNVPVGTYTIDEVPEAGWQETRNTCEDVDITAGHTSYCVIVNKKVQTPPNTDVCPNIEGAQATVPSGYTLSGGQCVPTGGGGGGQKGTIIVTKTTVGGDASFTFTPSYDGTFTLMNGQSNNSGLIDAGNYMVTENPVEGWTQTSATCVSSKEDTEVPGNLSLQAGETITCTFVNTKDEPQGGGDEEDEEEGTGGGNPPPSGGGSPAPTSSGNGNPFMFGIGGGNPGLVAGTSTGQVLGVSCGVYMDKHLRLGSKRNNPEQVLKLQKFLNKWMNAKLPETGFYGPQSAAAIKAFQEKYADDVLTPWGEAKPTGFVYLTTLRKINLIECPELTLPSPILIPWSANPSAQ